LNERLDESLKDKKSRRKKTSSEEHIMKEVIDVGSDPDRVCARKQEAKMGVVERERSTHSHTQHETINAEN
jgi:hypothetical protein